MFVTLQNDICEMMLLKYYKAARTLPKPGAPFNCATQL